MQSQVSMQITNVRWHFQWLFILEAGQELLCEFPVLNYTRLDSCQGFVCPRVHQLDGCWAVGNPFPWLMEISSASERKLQFCNRSLQATLSSWEGNFNALVESSSTVKYSTETGQLCEAGWPSSRAANPAVSCWVKDHLLEALRNPAGAEQQRVPGSCSLASAKFSPEWL